MRLLFIGDSLIEYGPWKTLLPEHETLNHGRAGETTSELLARSPAIIRACASADAVVIMSGTNDLLMEDFTFPADYERLLTFYQHSWPTVPLLVTSLLPFRVPWLAASTVPRINDQLAGLCRQPARSFLDLHSRFLDPQGRPRPGLFGADGVHLSAAGYRTWAASIAAAIANIQS